MNSDLTNATSHNIPHSCWSIPEDHQHRTTSTDHIQPLVWLPGDTSFFFTTIEHRLLQRIEEGMIPTFKMDWNRLHDSNDVKPFNAELNSICHLLALLGAHLILHVGKIRVKNPKHTRWTVCLIRIWNQLQQ
jgi:hypothetical protein